VYRGGQRGTSSSRAKEDEGKNVPTAMERENSMFSTLQKKKKGREEGIHPRYLI